MAQLVERVLGKDEVTGSNPVSSSRKPYFQGKTPKNRAFLCVFLAFMLWFGEQFGEQNYRKILIL